MKTLMIALLMVAITAGTAKAQQGGDRNGRPGGGGQMREMMKERIKTELKLTDVQADSVMNVQQDFQMKSRDVRMSNNLSEADKTTKMKQLEDERKAKLKGVLNEEQSAKLEAFYENMRKMREQRQGQRPADNQ